MMPPDSRKNLVVYAVTNWPGGGNDRLQKVLKLRPMFAKFVLVSPGGRLCNDEVLQTNRLPNPTGFLRFLGLGGVKRFLDRLLLFPSLEILFVWAVRRKLAKAIASDLAEGRKVCLLVTMPPHAFCLLGLYIKQRLPQVYWVLDWQDLWSYDENYFLQAPEIYRNRLRRLEKRALETADMNLTTNAHAGRVLETVYGVPAQRVRHIHHHYDPSDLDGATELGTEPSAQEGTMRIGFFGTLFKPPRVPGYDLIDAIAKMRQRGVPVELHVHGLIPANLTDQHERLARDGVFLHGRMRHQLALPTLRRYDFLLLFLADLANSRAVMSIKLPHYLMLGKPIIAIVPAPSALSEIVETTGAGLVLPSQGDWREQLEAVLRQRADAPRWPSRRPEQIERFAWENLSKEWIDVFDGALRLGATRITATGELHDCKPQRRGGIAA